MAKNNDTPPADESKKPPIEDQLKGKTLKVYMCMVKKKEPVGIREVQRDLGFSSPSVANYHIDMLVGLALADQDKYGRYFVVQRVQVGVLQAFVNIGGLTVPRLSFFAAFLATMLTAHVVLNFSSLNIHAIGSAVAGTAVFWFGTIRVWMKSRP